MVGPVYLRFRCNIGKTSMALSSERRWGVSHMVLVLMRFLQQTNCFFCKIHKYMGKISLLTFLMHVHRQKQGAE